MNPVENYLKTFQNCGLQAVYQELEQKWFGFKIAKGGLRMLFYNQ